MAEKLGEKADKELKKLVKDADEGPKQTVIAYIIHSKDFSSRTSCLNLKSIVAWI